MTDRGGESPLLKLLLYHVGCLRFCYNGRVFKKGAVMQNPIRTKIRAKKLGVLIRDARSALGKSLDECAQAIGVSPADFQDFELGVKSPSLPQVDLLAMYLNVPLDHFWGDNPLSNANERTSKLDLEHLIRLRQRMIGALIRQART